MTQLLDERAIRKPSRLSLRARSEFRPAETLDDLFNAVALSPEDVPAAPAKEIRLTTSAALFALTLLLSSTLLFLIQPMFAKLVLPRLGGTAAVWNTCMVFFQACLLAGYAYTHFLTRRLKIAHQLIIHAAVLSLPLAFLPIALPASWSPPTDANPILPLLGLLAVSVGIPFFVVSTTAPLLQRWFASASKSTSKDPYSLYVASNLGSMLALLGYPTIVEPLVRLGDQSHFWAMGYGSFAVLTLACGIQAGFRKKPRATRTNPNDEALEICPPVTWRQRLLWIVLALVPSSYLLGVTTYITTDVAAVPLLWVLPLALYLLTFILAFASGPIVPHRVAIFALPTALLVPVIFILVKAALPVWASVTLHLFAFFVATLVCHGELARRRPPARHLTEFYLMMSLGGVLGGAFNALAAPLLFTRAVEYPLAIVAACLLCPLRAGKIARRSDFAIPFIAGALAVALLSFAKLNGGGIHFKFLAVTLPVMLCIRVAGRRTPFAMAIAALLSVASFNPGDSTTQLEARRSFFGVHRVVRSEDGAFNELFHGTTLHGRQFADANGQPTRADEPLTYYHRTGPIGEVMTASLNGPPRRVGIIGLGVGSLAAYARSGDAFTFYEIDPTVRWVADESGHFNFLANARSRGADVIIVLGDARLTLASAPARRFDVLVLDAFSGDAIPLHLLTREAMSTYLDKLSGTGVLAVHISNLYLNLEPVVANLAADAGCVAIVKSDLDMTAGDPSRAGKTPSKWMLIARDRKTLDEWDANSGWTDAVARPSSRVWTDDFSNILSTLR